MIVSSKQKRRCHLGREKFRHKENDIELLIVEDKIFLKVSRGISPGRARVKRIIAKAENQQEEI